MKVVRYYPRALDGDGGMTGAVCSYARAVSELGEQATVVYDAEARRDPPLGGERLEWVALPHRGPKGFRVPVGLEAALEDAQLLVLHSAWTSHNLAAARIARRVGVPYLLEPRGAYDPNIVTRRRLTKALWWTAGEHHMVDRSVAVHMFFASEQDHLTRLGYAGPVVVAPNGVRVRTDHHWDGGSGGYLLWMGRFDPVHKGLDLLLDAMSLIETGKRPFLRLQGPDWRGRKRDVVEMVSARGLADWVTVGEAVYGDDKLNLLSRARAFVYPSRWEAFGNSPAEAAALGVPLLTTSYPLGTYLAERSGAIAVEPTPTALARGIRDVLGPAAAEMAVRAREVVSNDLSWDTVARSWLSQLHALL